MTDYLNYEDYVTAKEQKVLYWAHAVIDESDSRLERSIARRIVGSKEEAAEAIHEYKTKLAKGDLRWDSWHSAHQYNVAGAVKVAELYMELGVTLEACIARGDRFKDVLQDQLNYSAYKALWDIPTSAGNGHRGGNMAALEGRLQFNHYIAEIIRDEEKRND